MARHIPIFVLVLVVGLVAPGLVKRDTFDDIGDSVKNVLGLDDDKGLIHDIKNNDINVNTDNYCIKDSQCISYIQFCDTSQNYGAFGNCAFVLWFWVACVGVLGIIFFSCITSILCCCCSSLCRKAT